jgi:hypothetical protein
VQPERGTAAPPGHDVGDLQWQLKEGEEDRHDQELAELERDHDKQVATTKNQHDKEVATMKTRHEKDVSDLAEKRTAAEQHVGPAGGELAGAHRRAERAHRLQVKQKQIENCEELLKKYKKESKGCRARLGVSGTDGPLHDP